MFIYNITHAKCLKISYETLWDQFDAEYGPSEIRIQYLLYY